jgi:hypothetical protein
MSLQNVVVGNVKPCAIAESHRAYFIFGYGLKTPHGHNGSLCKAAKHYRASLLGLKRGALFARLVKLHEGTPNADKKVWREIDRDAARKSLHQDLMQVVDRILHGLVDVSHHNKSLYGGMAPLEWVTDGLPDRWLIALSNAASDRLKKQGIAEETITRLGATIEDVKLFGFASGKLLFTVGLRFMDLADAQACLPVALIEEAIYALGHAADRGRILCAVETDYRVCLENLAKGDAVVLDTGQRYGLRKASEEEVARPASEGPLKPRQLINVLAVGKGKQTALFEAPFGEVGLQALARAMVGFTAAATDEHDARAGARLAELEEIGPGEHGRVFTFCAVACAAGTDVNSLNEVAYRLSRRFTIDYELDANDVARSALHTFDNVVHGLCTQGAAVVVRNSNASFIQNFVTTAAVPTYFPLALLSYHEYLHLLHLTQDCAFIPNRAHPDNDKGRIQSLRYELAKFRLFFRYSHLSDIAHHNCIHRAWREALDLDRMLIELGADVREADLVLERYNKEKQSHRWRWAGAIAGLVAGFIASHEIIQVLLHLFHPSYEWWLVALKGDGTTLKAISTDPRFEAAVHFFQEAHRAEIWALVLSFVIAILAAGVAWLKGPRLEE